MGTIGIDFGGAVLDQCVGGVAQGAAAVHDVVDQDAGPPLDVADDVHHFRLAGFFTALVDDGEIGVEAARQAAGAHHAADVGRHHHGGFSAQMILDVLYDHRLGEKIVGGNIEKALNLPSMQVHRQDAVGAGLGDQVGHQLG